MPGKSGGEENLNLVHKRFVKLVKSGLLLSLNALREIANAELSIFHVR